MRKGLLSLLAASAIGLAGCASVLTSTDYTPYVSDTVYIGNGGAMEQMGGIDVWKFGLPNRPYKIIGLVTSSIKDGFLAEDWMLEASASEAKDNGADGIISYEIQARAGTPYVNVQQNNVAVNQSNTANIYGNQSAAVVGQSNNARVYTGPTNAGAGFASGFSSGFDMVAAMPSLQGKFLAIKYVDAQIG